MSLVEGKLYQILGILGENWDKFPSPHSRTVPILQLEINFKVNCDYG
jgi:hypothetical protein